MSLDLKKLTNHAKDAVAAEKRIAGESRKATVEYI